MINTGLFNVRGYKQMEHHRGVAWNCNIYKGNKKVGSASNEGCGGCDSIELDSEIIDEMSKVFKDIPFDDFYTEWTIESMVSVLCDNFQELKHMKTIARKKIVFLKKDGTFSSIDQRYSPQLNEAIMKKYGDDIEFILNDVVEQHGSKSHLYFNS